MSERQQRIVWFLWLVTFPPFIFYVAENTYELLQTAWIPIVSFTVLILIASLFPIQVKQTSLIPLHGISLAIFLHFGLLVEAMVTQVALGTTLSQLKLSKKESYRFPLNSLLFLATSFGAAGMFYLFGGQVGEVTTAYISALWLPILVYITTYIFLNNGLIFLIRYWFLNMRNIKFFDEALIWETVSGILILPVGLTLAVLYQEIGHLAVLLVGIPIVTVSLILKVYNESKKTTGLLKKASTFGYEVNDRLTVEEILELFIETCSKVFPAHGIFLYERTEGDIIRPLYTQHSPTHSHVKLSEGDPISQYVSKEGESILYRSSKQWQELDEHGMCEGVESILSAPSIRNHQVIGVVTLTTEKKNAFEKSHQILLEIIANYLSVALQNAKHLEQTKKESERCPLTNLYNFKYFERLLLDDYDRDNEQTNYAIILLDLDHFKRINDTYGHQSGNEVLKQVSSVLTNTLGSEAVLARYGGEEFVVLLKNTPLFKAYQIAEKVRQAIECHLFSVSEDLQSGDRKSVRITASIGVASKSEEDESPISVLRNADRAMYTGAKQKGRNKVAQFS
ncbi:hypothetical protein CR194_10815 [Salipaludibacillus keqinensis]|uniref:GGDEF domain-containing protein n=1 Tax=Salipaludibacillus keqinensis TaxID=2045207 RepID=A0A323TDZ5_9BACI|nr:sensor domain-containing diguanylate cyclase [Salipaludibacillus keqinensis]PYZ93642.1 hypothetical protein CR194_10815 [Salipaludibacillus keqinensis]